MDHHIAYIAVSMSADSFRIDYIMILYGFDCRKHAGKAMCVYAGCITCMSCYSCIRARGFVYWLWLYQSLLIMSSVTECCHLAI